MRIKGVFCFLLIIVCFCNISYAQDSDGDGIANTLDLDDDNDGILDIDECPTQQFSTGERLTWIITDANVNTSNIGLSPIVDTTTPHVLDAVSNLYSGQGNTITFDENPDYDFLSLPNGTVNTGNFYDDPDDNPDLGAVYEELVYADTNWSIEATFDLTDFDFSQYPNFIFSGNFYSDDSMNLYLNGTFIGSPSNLYYQDPEFFTATQASSGIIIAGINTIRIDIANNPNSTTGVAFDFEIGFSCNNDIDGDGTPNAQDLDADGDSCFDALEGDASETQIGYAELNPDGSIAGVVDSNGIPNTASGGQGIGNSQDSAQQAAECSPCDINNPEYVDTDGDLIADFCDLDDDNDGILDSDEGCMPQSANFSINQNSTSISLDNGFDGVVLDVTMLDNSFNLSINGNQLTSAEIEFNAPARTVEFADGTFYGDGNIPTIWNMAWNNPTNVDTPLIRLIVDTVGGVEIFGSKTRNGPLEPMVFVNGLTVNPVSWNTPTNTFIIDQVINGNTVMAGRLSSLVTTCDIDTDGDGLSDNLDLDSDNDGCPDALEGDSPESQIGYTELNPNGSIAGGVDSNGIPNTASGGQGIGTSQDVNQQAAECSPCDVNNPNFVDTDGDLVGDYCDLDNDNDGILDEVEYGCSSPSDLIFTNITVASPTATEVIANNGVDISFDIVLTNEGVEDFESGANGNFALGDRFVDQATNASGGDALSISADAPVTYMLSNKTNSSLGFDDGDYWRLTALGGFNVSDPNGQLVIISNSGNVIHFRPARNILTNAGTWQITTTGNVQDILIEANGNPWTPARLSFCSAVDTDGDSTPDYLDLDSDGDGCPDALEGDAIETQIGYTELNSNGSITGAVDVNGIPDTATGGQGIGTSQDSAQQAAECSPCDVNNLEYLDTDGDLVGDFCDLDDDNDGILDTDEKDCSGFVPIDLSAITNLSNSSINDQPISAVPFATSFSSAITPNHTSTVTTRPLGLANGDLRLIQANNTEISEYRIDFDHPTSIQLSQAELNGAFERLETWTITTEGGSISVNNPVIDVVTDNGTIWNDTELQNITGNLTNSVTFSPRTAFSDGNISVADSEWSLTAVQVKSLTIRLQTASPVNNASRIKISTNCVPLDTDVDGTPNDIDLDSDSDGCPDALEGDAAENQIGYAQLNPDSSITGVVNADGIPNTASGGQGIGTSYDATQQAAECSPCDVNNPNFVDTDGDLVGDLCDFDDDNDGIFDCDESSNQISGRFTWALNDPSGGLEVDFASDPEILTYPLSSTGTMSFGAGTSVDLSSSQVLLTSIVSPNLSEAVANEEYIEVSFTTGATSQFRIENIQSGWFTPSNSGDSYHSSAFFGKTSSANPSAVSGDILHTNTGATYIQFDHLNGTLQLEPNEDYTLRFYVFGQIDDDPSTNSIFDDISIFLTACEAVDTDGDGTFDHLDLDSDEDGCDDVIEAGFTDDNNDGLLGPNPVVVDGDGRVTSGSDGYTTPADADSNGTFDFQEAGTAPTITTQATNLILCPGCSGVFTVETNNADTFQWQVFNGTNWDNLSDGGIYSGTSTAALSITQPTPAENNSLYRLIASSNTYSCAQLISDEVSLSVRVTTVITNRQRTYRVNKN